MKNIFIINNAAGLKNGEEIVNKLIEELSDECRNNNEFIYKVTKGPKDATIIAKEICQEYSNEVVNVFACGGDGTCFEVCNGLVGHKNIHFGILPVGSCNDFLKTYPGYNFMSLEDQINGSIVIIDALKIGDEYSINVANFGYDAKSNYDQIRYRKKFKKVKTAYNFALVKNILSPKLGDKVEVYIDDELVYDGKTLLINVANAKYYGGGYKCSPEADCSDGLLNLTIIKKVSVVLFLRMVKFYKRGEHLNHPVIKKKLVYKTGKKVLIKSFNDLYGCLDGETRIKKEFTIEMVEKCISFILPKKE